MLKSCKTCGLTFRSKPSQKRVYCSRKCYHGPRLEAVMVPCGTCGKTYKGKPSKHSRYCSRGCGFAAQRTSVTVQCGYCGKTMIRPPSASSGRRFCSYACRAYALSVGKTIAIKLSGDRGPRPYSRCYWRRQASRARNRDGYRCQDCGLQFEKGFIPKRGQSGLDVHHKIPLRLGGSDHLSNLISLCRKCHRKADAAIQSEELRNWPVEALRPKHVRHKPLPNHCKHGHELTPDNVIPRSDNNGRRCLTCYQIRNKRKYQETKNNPREMARLKDVGRRFAIANPERIREINAAYRTRQKQMSAGSGSVITE